MDSRPIGVFDSGIGGLTVVRAIRRELPEESLIYFGDTARVPYGNKSPETVQRYSREIATLLVERGVKMIVVACNTASAHALESLRRELEVPVLGVIEPGARAAVKATQGRAIGVIGTTGTVRSGAYERAIKALAPDMFVAQKACPLFVPLAEEGWLDSPASRLIAHEYLDPLAADGIDTLVLGCTHYPLLKPLLFEVMGGVTLIDSADETARAVKEAVKGMAAGSSKPGAVHFIVSDVPESFRRVGEPFLGEPVSDVETVAFA